MFHWKNGVHFGRRRDGGVRILQFDGSVTESVGGYPVTADSELEGTVPKALVDFIIDSDSWASIVSSVSAGGEIDGRFYSAKQFHDSKGQIEIRELET